MKNIENQKQNHVHNIHEKTKTRKNLIKSDEKS